MREITHWIGGRALSGRDWFEDINPATGRACARVALGGAAEIDRAVEAARRAMRGAWGRTTPAERGALLGRVAALIRERAEEFLRAEIADTGKPARLARSLDVPRGAANFQIFAEMARASHDDSYFQTTSDGRGAFHYTAREPIGVVGIICPWNLPLLLMTWKVAPALAAGNAVVVKPSEETPATAALLGQVIKDAGVPDGVYNVVHGFGPEGAGQALVEHPEVGAITFTGETHTGRAIMRGAARGLKKISFELGGKNPAIIFADANFERAVEGTHRSVFTNCGQVCLCSERVYVERPIFERFVEALADSTRELRPGDPWEEATTIGPLISAAHRDKVLEHYASARAEGAKIHAGGGRARLEGEQAGGFFVEPTIWTGLPESARAVREEIFGPACHIAPFDEEEEAIAMANETDYGLCAAVWTQDVSRAHRVPRSIRAGLVWVNDWYVRDLRVPFGGMKASGIGREGGTSSLDFYSEAKSVCVRL